MRADLTTRAGRAESEDGFTLVELVVACSLLLVVLGAVFNTIARSQTTMGRLYKRSQSSDEALLAVQRLDRIIRSGNILYDPSAENDAAHSVYPGLSLRVYTQANSVQKCVQWRISSGRLEERSWSPTWQYDGSVSGWRPLIEDVVNTTAKPAFSIDSGSGFGGRLLKIDMLVNARASSGSNVEQKASIEGRNTEYGYDPNVCNAIPGY